MIDLIFSLTLNVIKIFFSIMAVLGLTYGGSDSSPIYIMFNVFLCVLSIILVIINIIKKRWNLNICIALFFPIIIIFLFIINILIYGTSGLVTNFFIIMMLWITSAVYIAIYYAFNDSIKNLYKWFDIQMLIMTLACIKTIFVPFIVGGKISYIAGSTYQEASYIAAFCYIINMNFLFMRSSQYSFLALISKKFNIVRYTLIPIHIICAVLSGGRGAFVAIVFYSIYIIFLNLKNKKNMLIIMGMILLLLLIYYYVSNNPTFSSRLERIFSYVNSDGLDITQTSGRDSLYIEVLEIISKKIILGYGIFSSYYVIGHLSPHNIILEILLEGGVVYLIFWLIIAIYLIKKYKDYLLSHEKNILFILITLSIVNLLFSGSYWQASFFWFVISYIGVKKSRIEKEDNQ